jgi:hypothetical protein
VCMGHIAKKRILFDILFWTLLKGYELFFYTTSSNFEYALNTSLNRFPAELILYYTGINYMLPVYFEKRNTRRFLLKLITTLFFAIIAYRICRYFLFPGNRIHNDFWKTLLHIPSFFVAPFYFIPIPALGFIIFIFRKLHLNELQKRESDKQRMIAEVNLLKSQIQPHFLFNTLNNLYGLALSSSSNTTDSIMRLSKIMEYMLYNSEREQVPLGLEMQYIRDYIELEKLRYGNRLQVSLDIDDSLQDKLIAPLLLFPFIENAFKHGSGRDEGDTWISVSLQKEDAAIVYVVVNSIPSGDGAYKTGNGRGYGLQNLHKRLNLAYPAKYKLEQIPGEASYMSVLKLDL